jgi:F-type H+-transporting ATPase subunit b
MAALAVVPEYEYVKAMMYSLLILAAEKPIPMLLDPKAGLFVWTLVVFGLVLFILWRYAWGPISTALAKREETIDNSIKRAERALDEARQIASDNEKARREAEVSAQKILRQAKDAAEKLSSEQLESTQSQVEGMLGQAREEIEQAKKRALKELRTEVAELAIEAAEKVVSANMDSGQNRKIVDDFMSGLSEN